VARQRRAQRPGADALTSQPSARWGRRVVLTVAALLGLAAAWLANRLNDHPSLARFARYRLPAASAAPTGAQVRVTFLGVATLLIDDGETALLTDGFFSRPSKLASAFTRIAPDRERIAAALQRAGVDRLKAVIVVHSHYDHAMDAPEVARLTGAQLIGSPSTANIARGAGLPEAQIRIAAPDTPMQIGAFTVTMVPSRHIAHGVAMGEITTPLVPPARSTDYLEGGSYSVLIAHPLGSLLVQGSAGWVAGALAGHHADVVLLGIGLLGREDDGYREAYYREVVDTVGARCVIPIHFDDFTLPLDDGLLPVPRLLDDVDGSLDWLAAHSATRGVGFGLLPLWDRVALLGTNAVTCPKPTPE
jgi:L-ascorbate metabolism protein UlaG (beta-lactamase superfamily)